MNTNEPRSEYRLPIFISSAVRGLEDLRAELREHLRGLGYAPILSSEDGFHGLGEPSLEPWERCLPVLETCYVVVLILDANLSRPLPWPHFEAALGQAMASPVEAEYLYARRCGRAVLVFVRQSLDVLYETYRQWLDEASRLSAKGEGTESVSRAEKAYVATLPGGTSTFEALRLLHRIHSDRPQPWIAPFDESPRLKDQVQRQLVSELVRHYRDLEKSRAALLALLRNPTFAAMSETDRNKILNGDAPAELVRIIESRSKDLDALHSIIEHLQSRAATAEQSAASSQDAAAKTDALRAELKSKEAELIRKEAEIENLRRASGDIASTGLDWLTSPTTAVVDSEADRWGGTTVTFPEAVEELRTPTGDVFLYGGCAECNHRNFVTMCDGCKRHLCADCTASKSLSATQPCGHVPRVPTGTWVTHGSPLRLRSFLRPQG